MSGANGAAAASGQKFTIDSISGGEKLAAQKILIYGPPKVGKTGFAAGAHDVVFLSTEEGLTDYPDAKRFKPEPTTLSDIVDRLTFLENGKHSFRTLAIDTVDWLELKTRDTVAARNRWAAEKAIEFNSAQKAAAADLRGVLAQIDRIRRNRDMEIIMVGHALPVQFKNPTGPDYLKWELDCGRGEFGQLLYRWADVILFAATTVIADRGKKAKAAPNDPRWIHSDPNPAYVAGGRIGLPPRLPLDYESFDAARARGRDPAALLDSIRELLLELDLADSPEWAAFLKNNEKNPFKLSRGRNRLLGKIAEREEAAGASPAA